METFSGAAKPVLVFKKIQVVYQKQSFGIKGPAVCA